jgi:hypothetical protein
MLDLALADSPWIVVQQHSLGKPPVINTECVVDVTAILRGLPSGTYVAIVTAYNAYGSSSGPPSGPFPVSQP